MAGGAKGAADARGVLKTFEVGINDAANGVYLSATRVLAETRDALAHAVIHTKDYYNSINAALLQATSKQDVINILSNIRASLLNGGKP